MLPWEVSFELLVSGLAHSPGTYRWVDRYYRYRRVYHHYTLRRGALCARQQRQVGPVRRPRLRQGMTFLFRACSGTDLCRQFGKPMYSTRIILGDLNPVWEETAVMLLTMDEVRSKEDLSAMLWDSDKRSAE